MSGSWHNHMDILACCLPVSEATLFGNGTSTWVLYGDELSDRLYRLFGAKGLCLKTFFYTAAHPLDTLWEGVPVWETAVVQNLFAENGLAPRVYGFVYTQQGLLAEAVEFADGEKGLAEELLEKFLDITETYGIRSRCRAKPGGALKWDAFHGHAASNWLGGKFVDFGGKYRASLYQEFEQSEPIHIFSEESNG